MTLLQQIPFISFQNKQLYAKLPFSLKNLTFAANFKQL